MKRLLLVALAVVLVAIFASVKLRKRPSEPEGPDGSWEPAPAASS